MKYIKKILIAGICLTSIISSGIILYRNTAHAEEIKQHHILFITSQPFVTDWFSTLNHAFEKELEARFKHDVKISYEYVADKNITDPEFVDNFIVMLNKKYEHIRLDTIIGVMPAGCSFLIKYGEETFPGKPKIYALPSKEQIGQITKISRGVIVESTSDIPGTIERMRTFLPNTENLYVLSGAGKDDLYYVEVTRKAIEHIRWPKNVIYRAGIPPDDLAEELSKLPEHSVILMLTYLRDIYNKPCTTVDVMKKVAFRTNAPIFGFYDTVLGHGIVGGKLTSAESYGKAVATAVSEISTGRSFEKPLNIKAEIRDMYDWRQLERWGISKNVLPAGSVIKYREIPFWESNPKLTVFVLTVFLIQTLLIVILLVNYIKRRRAEKELTRYCQHLEDLVKARTEELEKTNIELIKAKDQAEEADRIKSAFLATMSHELRTPLNSIIGFTGIILQGLAGPINEEQTKQLGMVRQSSRHLLDLISDVLDISKIESRQLQVSSEIFDIRQSAEKAVSIILPMAEKKGLHVHTEIEENIGEIKSDQRRTEQVIINLLTNAVKFTDKGTVILKCYKNSESLILSVTDTGMGIKPEDIKTIFKPFRQVDSGITRKQEGTGLGLTITKKLLSLMGGSIKVESEPGRGSIFTVSLPLNRGE